MKSKLKHIILLTLAFGIFLAWTDFCCMDGIPLHHFVNSHHECSDVSEHSEISHHHGPEDQIFGYDSKTKPSFSGIESSFLPFKNMCIKNNFIASIWQPPKFI